jgi:hypothetical protein
MPMMFHLSVGITATYLSLQRIAGIPAIRCIRTTLVFLILFIDSPVIAFYRVSPSELSALEQKMKAILATLEQKTKVSTFVPATGK